MIFCCGAGLCGAFLASALCVPLASPALPAVRTQMPRDVATCLSGAKSSLWRTAALAGSVKLSLCKPNGMENLKSNIASLQKKQKRKKKKRPQHPVFLGFGLKSKHPLGGGGALGSWSSCELWPRGGACGEMGGAIARPHPLVLSSYGVGQASSDRVESTGPASALGELSWNVGRLPSVSVGPWHSPPPHSAHPAL